MPVTSFGSLPASTRSDCSHDRCMKRAKVRLDLLEVPFACGIGVSCFVAAFRRVGTSDRRSSLGKRLPARRSQLRSTLHRAARTPSLPIPCNGCRVRRFPSSDPVSKNVVSRAPRTVLDRVGREDDVERPGNERVVWSHVCTLVRPRQARPCRPREGITALPTAHRPGCPKSIERARPKNTARSFRGPQRSAMSSARSSATFFHVRPASHCIHGARSRYRLLLVRPMRGPPNPGKAMSCWKSRQGEDRAFHGSAFHFLVRVRRCRPPFAPVVPKRFQASERMGRSRADALMQLLTHRRADMLLSQYLSFHLPASNQHGFSLPPRSTGFQAHPRSMVAGVPGKRPSSDRRARRAAFPAMHRLGGSSGG